MTWKFVKIWSSTYRRNIHVESTLIRRDAPIGMLLFFNFYFLPFLSNKIRVIITIFQLINSYVKVLHGNTLKNKDTSFFNIFLLQRQLKLISAATVIIMLTGSCKQTAKNFLTEIIHETMKCIGNCYFIVCLMQSGGICYQCNVSRKYLIKLIPLVIKSLLLQVHVLLRGGLTMKYY